MKRNNLHLVKFNLFLHNFEHMRQEAANVRHLLNNEQTAIVEAVLDAVHKNKYDQPNLFFIDGPGGTG